MTTIKAVAAVNAGPKILRQSNCMPVLVRGDENKAGS